MKKTIWLIALALANLHPGAGLRAETPPLFSPEPPEAGAAALVDAYLPLLAAGEFDQALALNDLRGMRQYLLDRRLTELKAKNPELTAENIEEMSVQIQLNDLNPARLQDILLGVMKEASYTGMTWRVRGFAPAPEGVGGYLASIDARTAEGKERPILLGIKKLGEQWLVAPEVIEELTGRKPVVRVAPSVTPPGAVADLANAFWKYWQTGELNEAYAMFGPKYRDRVSLLVFLGQAQEVIAKIGMPTAWGIVQSREIAPSVLGLGVNVQGSTAAMQTIMIFRHMGETWELEDSQFRPVPAQAAPIAPMAQPMSRPDLRPDLKPALEPTILPVTTEPPPATEAPAPTRPDEPVGAETP